ncbi:MAG: hypothetical protein K0R39_725 [Symbiobacteriaceae bacterium]|nr:hypothetical protein [Symbiobacteriaceae bacterium]
MSNHFDPGPPLTPDKEFCACEPPSGTEYLRATGVAFLTALLGGIAWFAVVLFTHRLWGFTTVLIGLVAGWAINRSAGNHRSVMLGVFGVVATAFATLGGYLLLWLPFVSERTVDRSFSWYDVLMMGLGGFMAYRLAGPKPKAKDELK